MLTFKQFAGINNVQPQERLSDSGLVRAENVDIGLSGEVSRRAGYSVIHPTCHKNLYQAKGYMLATVDGDLTAIHPDGTRIVVSRSLGVARVWYTDLPGGITAFSNGLINGITDGTTSFDWGVPTPEGLGAATDVIGALHPGEYTYYLTYARWAGGREGAPIIAEPIRVDKGGLFFTGLPVREGYRINVYLSGHNGEGAYMAGTTGTDSFVFTGKNSELTLPCRTLGTTPAPVGTLCGFWRGRALVAQDSVLWASQPHNHGVFDRRRDFKQFTSSITLIQPVGNGIYVGTEEDLIFLSGVEFDNLAFQPRSLGPVVLGSGVSAPGHKIKFGEGTGQGEAMLCIAGGYIVAGMDSGQVSQLTESVYRSDATQVSATFRSLDGIPQYIAVPQ